MSKFLIAGLGNIGSEYENTRHNIGFKVVETLAQRHGGTWKDGRFGAMCEIRVKGRILFLLKPNTYMNLSGKAVKYWMQQEKIEPSNLMVVLDDLSLEFGKMRLRPKGSDGGHNGLKSIQELIGTTEYPRLRFGIGNQFKKGQQVDYVLGDWDEEEKKLLPELQERSCDAVTEFVLAGLSNAMNKFNN